MRSAPPAKETIRPAFVSMCHLWWHFRRPNVVRTMHAAWKVLRQIKKKHSTCIIYSRGRLIINSASMCDITDALPLISSMQWMWFSPVSFEFDFCFLFFLVCAFVPMILAVVFFFRRYVQLHFPKKTNLVHVLASGCFRWSANAFFCSFSILVTGILCLSRFSFQLVLLQL